MIGRLAWSLSLATEPGVNHHNRKKMVTPVTKEEVQQLIDLAITRHNRNASIISFVVGWIVLGFYADGLFRLVERLTDAT